MTAGLTRQAVEDFLYYEAALLDGWKLDEWLGLLTGDCVYRVPSNDAQDGDPKATLYLIADDYARITGRVARLKDPMAHVEFPHSRTRRMISNVRILGRQGEEMTVEANFVVHRFRRDEKVSAFVGRYRYTLRIVDGVVKIASREAFLDAEELGSLGAVSFIL
jgi:p-cumate 2,3-dioxygenase beta subunit